MAFRTHGNGTTGLATSATGDAFLLPLNGEPDLGTFNGLPEIYIERVFKSSSLRKVLIYE